jgi:hypothetical protein
MKTNRDNIIKFPLTEILSQVTLNSVAAMKKYGSEEKWGHANYHWKINTISKPPKIKSDANSNIKQQIWD